MKMIKKLFKLSFLGIFAFVFIHVLLYSIAYFNPKIEIKTANSFSFYDTDYTLFFTGNDNKEWIKLDEISPNLINATLAIEDKYFYKHKGFDYLSILKAMYLNLKNKDIVQGASTITQQYARNLYLDMEKTWKTVI